MRNYKQTYQYDEIGNLLQMKSNGVWTRDYKYNFATNNHLLKHDENATINSYEYDAHGNTTKMSHLQELIYDYADQLNEVTLNLDGNKAYYIYNAEGERVRKVVEKGNIKEERFYIGDYELYTKKTNETLDTERETLHIVDDKQKVALIDYDTQNSTTTVRYQLTNHLDSASLELDETGAIITYEEYYPFGTTSYRSGRNGIDVSLKRYKYVHKELDNETGLYYYGMRYYAPWVARFISVDPLQFKYPELTPFQYASNNPSSDIDVDGAESLRAAKKKSQNKNEQPRFSIGPNNFRYGSCSDCHNKEGKYRKEFEEISPFHYSLKPTDEGYHMEMTNLAFKYIKSTSSIDFDFTNNNSWNKYGRTEYKGLEYRDITKTSKIFIANSNITKNNAVEIMLGGFIYGTGPELIYFPQGHEVNEELKSSAIVLKAIGKWYKENANTLFNGGELSSKEFGPKDAKFGLPELGWSMFLSGPVGLSHFIASAEYISISPTSNQSLNITIINKTNAGSGDYFKHFMSDEYKVKSYERNPDNENNRKYSTVWQVFNINVSIDMRMAEQINNK